MGRPQWSQVGSSRPRPTPRSSGEPSQKRAPNARRRLRGRERGRAGLTMDGEGLDRQHEGVGGPGREGGGGGWRGFASTSGRLQRAPAPNRAAVAGGLVGLERRARQLFFSTLQTCLLGLAASVRTTYWESWCPLGSSASVLIGPGELPKRAQAQGCSAKQRQGVGHASEGLERKRRMRETRGVLQGTALGRG